MCNNFSDRSLFQSRRGRTSPNLIPPCRFSKRAGIIYNILASINYKNIHPFVQLMIVNILIIFQLQFYLYHLYFFFTTLKSSITQQERNIWNEWCSMQRIWTVWLYWAGKNLGKWDEFCFESCPWYRIDLSTCWPAVQRATTVPRMPPLSRKEVLRE